MALPSGSVTLKGHKAGGMEIVPLPGGDLIATVCWNNVVRIFATATGALLRTIAGHHYHHEGYVHGLAALGGDMIASGDWNAGFRIWNARTGECVHETGEYGRVSSLAALDGGRFVACADDGHIVLFEHRDGRGVTEVRRVPHAHALRFDGLFSACGARLATACDDLTVAVWDAGSLERLAALDGHASLVSGIAMDDMRIVTCWEDETVRVHDAQSFACVWVLDQRSACWLESVTIIAGDHVLSTSGDESFCISSLVSGELLARVDVPFEVESVAVLRDGRLAVTGSCENAALLPAPAEAAHLILSHNAAAHPGLALRALLAIETGAHPSVMRRTLAGRRGPVR